MAKPKKITTTRPRNTTVDFGFEARLWLTADKFRGNMDAADYKHVVFGLIFVTYILFPFLGWRLGDIAVYGQESKSTTRQLAMMNLAIRGIEGDLGPVFADAFRRDLHKDVKADYALTNPPFNDSDWYRSDADFCPLVRTILQDILNAALVIREHHHVRQL